jgi:hypothetical protein
MSGYTTDSAGADGNHAVDCSELIRDGRGPRVKWEIPY